MINSKSQGRTHSGFQSCTHKVGTLINVLSHYQAFNKANKSNKFQDKIWKKSPPIQWNVLCHCGSLFLTLLHFQFHVITDAMIDYQFPTFYNLITRMLRI